MCNHDCFHCPHPDCICDEETPAEIGAAELRDKEAQGKPKRKLSEKSRERNSQYYQDHRERYLAYYRVYYRTHKEKTKAYKADYYQRNKARILAQQKEYQKANADKIKARDKERYRKKKEAAQMQAGTAPDRNDHNDSISPPAALVKGGEGRNI